MRTRVILLVLAIVSGGLAVAPGSASAEVLFDTVLRSAPGPLGGIAVIGDSLMLGSAYEPPLVPGWGPSLAQLLADRGWGPVRMVAGVGFQAGNLIPNNPSANMSKELTYERSIGFDPAVIVVSLGPNDMIGCSGSVDCAADDIRGLIDTAGPDHEVWWALQTMEKRDYQAAWNQALQIVAAERPNLTLWDWPSIVASTGVHLATDNTHLPGPAEYLARSVLMADDITARMGTSRNTGSAVAPPASDAAYGYLPVDPTRVIDTRDTAGQRLVAGATLTVDLAALAPTQVGAAATAVALNVTAAGPAAAGYLTVWPCGSPQPLASSVNFLAGQARGAQATTLLGPGHTVCIFSNAATDVVVDLQGVFAPTGGLLFQPITPDRKVDTRNSGRQSTITVQAPTDAKAVAATLTVTGGATSGFLSAFPCSGTIPKVSNVNWQAGETVAGAAFIPVAADGTFCVFTNSPTDVIVDITGVFGTPTSTLKFTPVAPTRMLDTRIGTGGWRGRQGVGQTIEIGAAPDTAQAVTGTITMVDPGLASYLTGTICGAPAGTTSSVNGAQGSVIANSLTVGLSPGGNLCITSLVSSHTLFDTTGWWAP